MHSACLLLSSLALTLCKFWTSEHDGTKLCQVEAKLINFGTNLEPSWALLGQVGPCWGHVGTRLGQVGAKLGQVEAKLG